jgi:hypothetical protein
MFRKKESRVIARTLLISRLERCGLHIFISLDMLFTPRTLALFLTGLGKPAKTRDCSYALNEQCFLDLFILLVSSPVSSNHQ